MGLDTGRRHLWDTSSFIVLILLASDLFTLTSHASTTAGKVTQFSSLHWLAGAYFTRFRNMQ